MDLKEILERTFEEENSWKLAASSLPLCPRRVFFETHFPPLTSSISWTNYYFTEVGKGIHRAIQTFLAKQNVLWGDWYCYHCDKTWRGGSPFCPSCGEFSYYKEVTVQTDLFNIKLDGILKEEDGTFSLLEIKTVFSSSKFATISPSSFPISWVWQTGIYVDAAKQYLSLDLKTTWFVVIFQREPWKSKIFSIPSFSNFFPILRKQWEKTNLLLEENKPQEEFPRFCKSPEESHSLHCPWVHECWRDPANRIP